MPAMATPGRTASGSINRSDVRAQTATGAFGSPTLYVPATTGHDEPVELMSYGNAQSILERERYQEYTRPRKNAAAREYEAREKDLTRIETMPGRNRSCNSGKKMGYSYPHKRRSPAC